MKAQLALCMKYMPAACMKSLTLTHEGWEFGFAKFQLIEMRCGIFKKGMMQKMLACAWLMFYTARR